MKKKILLIDDTEMIRNGIQSLLEKEGYNVETASDGLGGLEKAHKFMPDMILCDISMPEMDGYEVLEQVKKSPELATIPFIFLTAYSRPSDFRFAMEKGADDFLIKTDIKKALLNAINTQFEKYSRISQAYQSKVDMVGRNISYALPHEFRTVLNEVRNLANYLNAMAEKVDTEEIKEISQDILTSNKRLMKITENFLVYARMEEFANNPAKKASLRQFVTEEPLSIVRDIAQTQAAKYNRLNNVYIEEGEEHLAIEISPENFMKVVTELIDNALSFSQKGSLIIVRTWVENKHYYVEIMDRGRGMSEQEITNIAALAQFNRETHEQQGAGLGLVISKRIIELHDGTFKIISSENKGTNIIFRLYLKQ